jgi:hypothetical protein
MPACHAIALLHDYCQIVVTFGGFIVIAPQQTFAILGRTVVATGREFELPPYG